MGVAKLFAMTLTCFIRPLPQPLPTKGRGLKKALMQSPYRKALLVWEKKGKAAGLGLTSRSPGRTPSLGAKRTDGERVGRKAFPSPPASSLLWRQAL